MDIHSGDESDRKMREEPKAARQGPGNASMQHFDEPTAGLEISARSSNASSVHRMLISSTINTSESSKPVVTTLNYCILLFHSGLEVENTSVVDRQ